MAFDDTCAQCAYINPHAEKDGKFPCTHPKSSYKVVSARMRKSNCNYYCAIGVGKRSTSECRALEATSKKYGYYIVTAVCNMLGLNNSRYLDTFAYIHDEFMPVIDEYESFLADYEVNGPTIATKLEEEEDKEAEARYLVDKYLDEFSDLVTLERPDEASELYIRMYDELVARYQLVNGRCKPKRLLIVNHQPVIA